MSMTDCVTLDRYRAKVKQCEEYQIRDRMLSEELTKLRAENAALKTKAETASNLYANCRKNNEAQREQIVELKETNAALKRITSGWRKDAERYGWLRENNWPAIVRRAVTYSEDCKWTEYIDAAIDAAMEAEK